MSTTGIKNGRMSSTRSGLSAAEYRSAIDGVPGAALAPVGTVLPFAGPTAPAGWILCDGSAISRTTYAALFSAIGIAWGHGNTTTTFNIPDLRGYVMRGRDGGAARDPDRSSRTACNTGGNTGDNVGSVQDENYKSHNHGQAGSWDAQSMSAYSSGIYRAAWSSSAGGNFTNDGGNETRMKNANVNFIIKY